MYSGMLGRQSISSGLAAILIMGCVSVAGATDSYFNDFATLDELTIFAPLTNLRLAPSPETAALYDAAGATGYMVAYLGLYGPGGGLIHAPYDLRNSVITFRSKPILGQIGDGGIWVRLYIGHKGANNRWVFDRWVNRYFGWTTASADYVTELKNVNNTEDETPAGEDLASVYLIRIDYIVWTYVRFPWWAWPHTIGLDVLNIEKDAAPLADAGHPQTIVSPESLTHVLLDGSKSIPVIDPSTSRANASIAAWKWEDIDSWDGRWLSNEGPTCRVQLGPGTHTIRLTIACDDGVQATATTTVTITSADLVTGGGWVDSPAGAYAADPSLAGKASFGFVSKYEPGRTVPDGNTEFQLHAANLNFHSTTYEQLVFTGARAQFKGRGTINGQGDYGFMLTAIDGQVNSGDETDRFRIMIWDDTGIVYDTQRYDPDTADPTTVLGGGSIVIHR